MATPSPKYICAALVRRPDELSITEKLQRKQPDGNIGKRHGHDKGKRFGRDDILKLGTWNVRGLATKEPELNNELKRK